MNEYAVPSMVGDGGFFFCRRLTLLMTGAWHGMAGCNVVWGSASNVNEIRLYFILSLPLPSMVPSWSSRPTVWFSCMSRRYAGSTSSITLSCP